MYTVNVERKLKENASRLTIKREKDGETRTVTLSDEAMLDLLRQGNKAYGLMILDEFQTEAMSTRTGETLGDRLIIYPTLGLTGEAGEVAEKVKKVIRDDNGEWTHEKKVATMLEVFDVLWYCMALLQDLGFRFSMAATMGLAKLASRKERNKLHGNGDER